MSVDYDLVVIDRGISAFDLAARAAKLKARVALVTEPNTYRSNRASLIAAQILKLPTLGTNSPAIMPQVISQVNFHEHLETLQILGVDVVSGTGKFIAPDCFETEKRKLRARKFAIAKDIQSSPIRKILGLDPSNCLTYDRLFQLDQLPKSLVIIGGDHHNCAIAQALNHLGVKVILIAEEEHILANVDVEIARFLQAKMEVDGIEIYTGSRVTAVEKIERERERVWVGNIAVECDRILLNHHTPIALDLNLTAARVKFESDYIRINSKLQTSNHRIYLCQSHADVATILQNTMFLPTGRVSPSPVTLIAHTEPELASLGMTEIFARLKYGQDLYVLRDQIPDLGFCKVLCRGNGEIVGAHMVGAGSREAIGTIAIAMHNKIKIPQLEQLKDISSSSIAQIAPQLAEQKYERDRAKQLRLESWFNLRREYDL